VLLYCSRFTRKGYSLLLPLRKFGAPKPRDTLHCPSRPSPAADQSSVTDTYAGRGHRGHHPRCSALRRGPARRGSPGHAFRTRISRAGWRAGFARSRALAAALDVVPCAPTLDAAAALAAALALSAALGPPISIAASVLTACRASTVAVLSRGLAFAAAAGVREESGWRGARTAAALADGRRPRGGRRRTGRRRR
jgi:hypothetical protein